MQAIIVNAWKDDQAAYLAVHVTESWGMCEYVGSVPLAEYDALPSDSAKEEALLDAVRARRGQHPFNAGATESIATITGTVTL